MFFLDTLFTSVKITLSVTFFSSVILVLPDTLFSSAKVTLSDTLLTFVTSESCLLSTIGFQGFTVVRSSSVELFSTTFFSSFILVLLGTLFSSAKITLSDTLLTIVTSGSCLLSTIGFQGFTVVIFFSRIIFYHSQFLSR